MKMSLEHQNPFITGWVAGSGTQTRAYPATSYSFLTISDPNILLWALKPAEDGIARGVVARVWNQGNSPASYALSFARPVAGAERLTHIETTVGPANVTAGQLTANISQQQLQTHLVKFQ
jgi:alpha-mannosidase